MTTSPPYTLDDKTLDDLPDDLPDLTVDVDFSVASGDGVLFTFPSGERVLFPTRQLVSAAAEALLESGYVEEPEG